MDILMVKLGALGDVVNTFPLAVLLKRHLGARIHWLVQPLSHPLVSRHASVDNAILFDRKSWPETLPGVIGTLRGMRFDIALDLQRTAKSALFTYLSPARRRIGFDRARCKEMTWVLPFERIPAADPGGHMVRQYLEFARYLGVEEDGVTWDIPAGDPPGCALPERYVVLNIGATKPANRWKASSFAALAGLVKDRFGLPCVLTGGPEDRSMAAVAASGTRGEVVDLVGRTTIMELVSVLAGARAVVSCDTGPMHLAVALGKEVVALFGPADPGRTGPYRGHVVMKDLPCSPCNRRDCSDPRCMDAILPEDVAAELERVLG
ncbi:MAG TPA: glycosyltransferase family 9 protein [Deltaproteobacteria bacterium]|jgi:ADP-heptose:LPS heptosyltransferase|nr:glycosyltransferase family 9 protein [Deltaproteobacteria bacterium]HOI07725.1 glycosyltransferase family 9 protein [Deltaproteobacteria bacterium]